MPSSLRRPVITACAALLLALHAWLGISATLDKSVTSDETAHLTSGYSYWRFNDYRLQPENGNLPQRWAALPLLVQRPVLEPAREPWLWSVSHVWRISQAFFFESGNSTDFLLATARAAMMLWSVATGILVFVWSRRLWGDWGGLFSLSLYAFSATLLAHGPLVTSDMTVTFFLLAAVGAYWRQLERITPGTVALSLVTTSLAAVAKFSFLLLIPTFGVLLVWRLIEQRPLVIACGGREHVLKQRHLRFFTIALSVVAHLVAAWAVIWVFFGLRYSAFAPGLPEGLKFYLPWDMVMPQGGFWKAFILAARDGHWLPEAFLQGFSYVLYASEARGAFLIGDYSNTGWVSFFPWAFLIKTPPAELLAVAMAAGVALLRWRGRHTAILKDLRRVAPLLALFIVYWAFSLTSHLNIGHRHILPTYPVLFILAGLLAREAAHRFVRIGAVGLALLAMTTAWCSYPNYLAYFNPLVGGSSQGYRYLVDSSLDWGQELPSLARWLRENRHSNEPIYLSYFGNGDPAYEGIHSEQLAPFYNHLRPRYWTTLQPGLYCVSATMLQDVYSFCRGKWDIKHEILYQQLRKSVAAEIAAGRLSPVIYDLNKTMDGESLKIVDRLRFARLALYLRVRRADAVINHSVFIHRLSATELAIVVDGSLQELDTLLLRTLDNR